MNKNTPKRIEHRIDDLFWNMKLDGNNTHYQSMGSYFSSNQTLLVWKNNATPDTFSLVLWNNKEDWRKLEFKIISTDDKIVDLIMPLVVEYVKEMEIYYHEN